MFIDVSELPQEGQWHAVVLGSNPNVDWHFFLIIMSESILINYSYVHVATAVHFITIPAI